MPNEHVDKDDDVLQLKRAVPVGGPKPKASKISNQTDTSSYLSDSGEKNNSSGLGPGPGLLWHDKPMGYGFVSKPTLFNWEGCIH
ncbi:unnamed protein product [Citrullus colocynthis]|uniref:Uncharacterized protein n=1 Tax=Citrullus colocynthis TaxID=252529 RepID=A0ABP0YRK5_9ROSI